MAPRGRGRLADDRLPLDDGYPWEHHEKALHHLSRLEVVEARESLAAMLPQLRSMPPERARAAGCLAFDLIGQVRSHLGSPAASNGDARASRWKEARAFAEIQNGATLAALFQAALAESLPPYRAPANPLVARARGFIEQNYSRKLSLRHVAEFLNVSRNYLSSLFRKECGCTITEYIHQIRVKRAEALLIAGGRTVSEIAYQVGYQNYRDFYRNFVKYDNHSPTTFRRIRAERPALPGAAVTA